MRASSSYDSSQESPDSVSSGLTKLNTDNIPDLSLSLSHSPTSTMPTSAGSIKESISPSPSMSSLRQERDSVAENGSISTGGSGGVGTNGNGTNGRAPPRRRDSEAKSVRSTTSQAGSAHSASSGANSRAARRPSVMLFASSDESTSLGGEHAIDLIPFDSMHRQDEHSQFMHLYRAVTFVLSTKEAMREELAAKVAVRDPELRRFGWRDEDYAEPVSRARFEIAVDQYQRCVGFCVFCGDGGT